MFYHPSFDAPPDTTEADKAWLFVLYCAALGLFVFIVMVVTTGALPW